MAIDLQDRPCLQFFHPTHGLITFSTSTGWTTESAGLQAWLDRMSHLTSSSPCIAPGVLPRDFVRCLQNHFQSVADIPASQSRLRFEKVQLNFVAVLLSALPSQAALHPGPDAAVFFSICNRSVQKTKSSR